MTARSPLFLTDSSGTNQIQEGDSTYMDSMNEFAGYVFAQDPNPSIEVNTANGTAIPGQPFVDTYWIAGTYSTRVDRFATEAETDNISMVTDNYSRIREVTDVQALPTGDANNHEYPLYLYAAGGGDIDTHLRSMTRQDFIDTFVSSTVLNQFGGGGTTKAKGGTYFMTTTASPTNATLVSATPAAVNSYADLTAYTAGGIEETQKQTIDTNYYIAKVDYPASSYTEVFDQLPIYWDYATGEIKSHTPTSWANLLGPFLRYYLSSNFTTETYRLSYNVDGSNGVVAGTLFTDERRTPDGSAGAGGNYQQLYVNTDDYRTQEFPTGTLGVIAQQRFKIYQGVVEAVSLQGTIASPEQHSTFPITDGDVTVGFRFNSDGTVEHYDSEEVPTYFDGGSNDWVNVSPPGNTYYIRFALQSGPSGPSYGPTLNTWQALTSDRVIRVTDSRPSASYSSETAVFKVEIASDSGGTNIIDTGYYEVSWEGGA